MMRQTFKAGQLASGPAGERISWLRDEKELWEIKISHKIGMAEVAGSVEEA
jgi:hypothetical protein